MSWKVGKRRSYSSSVQIDKTINYTLHVFWVKKDMTTDCTKNVESDKTLQAFENAWYVDF